MGKVPQKCVETHSRINHDISGRTVGPALRGRPWLREGVQETGTVAFQRYDQNHGGHGGPSLEYVRVIYVTSVNLRYGPAHDHSTC